MHAVPVDLGLWMERSYKSAEMSHSGLKDEISRLTLALSWKLLPS